MTATRPKPAQAERVRRPAPERKGTDGGIRSGAYLGLLAVVGLLNVIGLMMVLSASSVNALRELGSSWVFFNRQLMWTTLGVLALVLTLRIDYRLWRRAAIPLLVVTGLMLMAVVVPGVGVRVYGSTRWLGAGPFTFQPSELMKLALALFSADVLTRRASDIGSWKATVLPVTAVLGVVAMLVMKQPDMGTTIVLAAIALSVVFVAGVPMRQLGVLGAGMAGAALVIGVAAPYRRARLLTFLHPWANKSNTGYQLVQSLVGISTGRIAGVGLGASRAKWGFLPNAHTDFIFAILGEELGLVGALLVVLLFAMLAVLGVRVAARAPDRFGMLLASGITAWLVVQAFVNMGAVIGILPVTGVPLPFVSFGGSSLVIAMAATGILLNVARQARPPAAGA